MIKDEKVLDNIIQALDQSPPPALAQPETSAAANPPPEIVATTRQSAPFPSLSQSNPHRDITPYREVPDFPPKNSGNPRPVVRNHRRNNASYARMLQRQWQPTYRNHSHVPSFSSNNRPFYYRSGYQSSYNFSKGYNVQSTR